MATRIGTRVLALLGSGLCGAAAACLPAGPAPAADDTPSAAAIFAQARATWRARTVPPYIRYTTTMQTRVGHKTSVERDEIVLRTRDRVAFLRAFRGDQASGHGTVTITSPRLVPDSTFGLAPHGSSEVESPFAPAPLATSPPVIGHVVATSRPRYEVTLVGEEEAEGNPCWHLALRPAPGMSGPLRDLWVDRRTSDVRKLEGVIDVRKGPFHRAVPFDATFAEYGGAWLIARGHVAGGFQLAFLRYTGEGEIDFSHYAFPAAVPDACFERGPRAAGADEAACTSP